MSDTHGSENQLGPYLKDRRARLDPAVFGLPPSRRRTPGLRREEVAQRANISPTWYTWLEQGRGGAPSADVLDRIARALMLTEVEREHLFLLGLGRPPDRKHREAASVSPRLQRILDALEPSAAMVHNPLWDVLAWNRAAPIMLSDYGAIPPGERNVLRQMFCNSGTRAVQEDWESVARFIVGAFRATTLRAGITDEVEALVTELAGKSADFARIWAENEVRDFSGGLKRLNHPILGPVEYEYSCFTVEGRSDLSMIVYSPTNADDAAKISALIKARG